MGGVIVWVHEAPELPRNGQIGSGRKKNRFDNIKPISGTEAKYLAAQKLHEAPELPKNDHVVSNVTADYNRYNVTDIIRSDPERGNSLSYTLRRLKQDHPELYQRVRLRRATTAQERR